MIGFVRLTRELDVDAETAFKKRVAACTDLKQALDLLIKRRVFKRRDFRGMDQVKDMRGSGRFEKICLTYAQVGLICPE